MRNNQHAGNGESWHPLDIQDDTKPPQTSLLSNVFRSFSVKFGWKMKILLTSGLFKPPKLELSSLFFKGAKRSGISSCHNSNI